MDFQEKTTNFPKRLSGGNEHRKRTEDVLRQWPREKDCLENGLRVLSRLLSFRLILRPFSGKERFQLTELFFRMSIYATKNLYQCKYKL